MPGTATHIRFSGTAAPITKNPSIDPIAEGFTAGTYLVGPDISPGRYRVIDPGGFAYGARLDADLDIIDNDLNENSVILTIQATDFAFSYSGSLERLRD